MWWWGICVPTRDGADGTGALPGDGWEGAAAGRKQRAPGSRCPAGPWRGEAESGQDDWEQARKVTGCRQLPGTGALQRQPGRGTGWRAGNLGHPLAKPHGVSRAGRLGALHFRPSRLGSSSVVQAPPRPQNTQERHTWKPRRSRPGRLPRFTFATTTVLCDTTLAVTVRGKGRPRSSISNGASLRAQAAEQLRPRGQRLAGSRGVSEPELPHGPCLLQNHSRVRLGGAGRSPEAGPSCSWMWGQSLATGLDRTPDSQGSQCCREGWRGRAPTLAQALPPAALTHPQVCSSACPGPWAPPAG